MKRMRTLASSLVGLASLILATGCSGSGATPVAATRVAKGSTAPHGHGAGPHDGALADWGDGDYHVEFTVDHDKKQATVYVLGSNEKTAVPIKAKDGQLTLNIDEPAFQVVLKAVPETKDPEGTSSRFVGTHDSLGIVREFSGTISGEADGVPYVGRFKEEPAKDKK